MRSNKEPCRDLATVQKLVAQGKYRSSKRVRGDIRNHGYDYEETVEDVISSIEPHHYYKTDELEHIPGTFADIYRHIECYDEEWYVKFFFDKDDNELVIIWSLKPDGYAF